MIVVDVYNQGEKEYQCEDPFKRVQNPAKWKDCSMCRQKPIFCFHGNRIAMACACKKGNEFSISPIQKQSILSFLNFSRKKHIWSGGVNVTKPLMKNGNKSNR